MANNSVRNIDSVVYHNVEDLFTVVGASEENIEKLQTAPYSYWRETFKQLIKKPLAIISFIVILLIIFLTIFGPIFKSYQVINIPDVSTAEKFDPYLPWSADHWFGTGGNKMQYFKGLDLWTCVWVGARLSLILGTVVALIDTFLGILIGSLWGYFRKLDPIMIEIRNFVDNVPSLLLYFLLMQFLTPDFWTIVFLLTMFGWLGLAGFIRNQIIIIRNREYNIASQTLGSSPKAMITHNLLPYLISVIVTVVST
ncbi:MAG: ABC transporter permease subunit, partial [Bacilli bacterium]